MDIEDSFVHRKIVVEGIKTLIDYCTKTHNMDMLDHIQDFLISLIAKTPEKHEEYLNNLYGFVGEIRLYMMRK